MVSSLKQTGSLSSSIYQMPIALQLVVGFHANLPPYAGFLSVWGLQRSCAICHNSYKCDCPVISGKCIFFHPMIHLWLLQSTYPLFLSEPLWEGCDTFAPFRAEHLTDTKLHCLLTNWESLFLVTWVTWYTG